MGFWDKIKRTLKDFLAVKPRKSSNRRKKKVRSTAQKTKLKTSSKAKSLKRYPKKEKRNPKTKASKQIKSEKKLKPKTETQKSVKKAIPGKRAEKAKIKVSKSTPGEFIGSVTHFFPQVNVAALKIDKRGLMVGEKISILGHTTKFKTTIESMQINRKPVINAVIGDEIGIKVPRRVRAGDKVFFQPN